MERIPTMAEKEGEREKMRSSYQVSIVVMVRMTAVATAARTLMLPDVWRSRACSTSIQGRRRSCVAKRVASQG